MSDKKEIVLNVQNGTIGMKDNLIKSLSAKIKELLIKEVQVNGEISK